jgi:LPXTG-motif cell wall-anchored protein
VLFDEYIFSKVCYTLIFTYSSTIKVSLQRTKSMSKVRSLLALVVSVMFVFSSVLVVGAQSATPTPAAEEEAAAEMAAMNIVETAVAAGDFQTLVAAVQAAGLVDALSGEGPFTVFAPTDAAFAALPEGTIESLLADPSGALTDILLYHVVSGQVLSSDLSDGMTAVTLGGAELTFSVSADGVQVNGANVVAADVMASNGVIHVIDAVLLPPAAEEEMVEEAAAEATPTPAAEEEAAAEATPTPVAEEEAAEATPTPAAEEEAAAVAEATATPAAEEEAPHLLPVTGATQSNSTLPWMAVLFAMVLAAGAFFVRRRTA